jgi:geranylgeranyl pyrophosphate synthase
MVFQIHDDILGIWELEDTVGKSAGDICQRKKSLPVAYGLQNSKGAARKSLGKLYSQESIEGEDIEEVTKILDNLGARIYAESVAEQYYDKALAHLKATRLDISSLAPLKEAASFLSKRDF